MNVVIIQARCGSARLANKIFLNLNDEPILLKIVNKCKKSKRVDKIIVATSTNIEDNKVSDFCNLYNIDCYRGDERDLLNRFYYLCKLLQPKNIIRITADCPFVDVNEMDNMIDDFNNSNIDYMYNTEEDDFNNYYPEGSDIEICNFKTLEYIWKNEKDIREHSIGIIRLKKNYYKQFINIKYFDFNLNNLSLNNDLLTVRLSIDNINDYEVSRVPENYYEFKRIY